MVDCNDPILGHISGCCCILNVYYGLLDLDNCFKFKKIKIKFKFLNFCKKKTLRNIKDIEKTLKFKILRLLVAR